MMTKNGINNGPDTKNKECDNGHNRRGIENLILLTT
jgi:hypothetical protein